MRSIALCGVAITIALTLAGTRPVLADPTDTPTETATETPTDTATETATETPTDTPSETPTQTHTDTPSETPTDTPIPTETPTDTATATVTDTPTESPTPTETDTPTETPTPTDTGTPTETPTDSPSPTATETPTESPTPTETFTPSETPTDSPTPTTTETPTESPTPTETDTPTETPTYTDTPTATSTSTPTETPTPTATNTPIFCQPAPLTNCRRALKSALTMTNSSDDTRDKLSWKWSKGEATNVADLADPTNDSLYQMCIYSGADLLAQLQVPPAGSCGGKPCWKEKAGKGYRFKDRSGHNDGILAVDLAAGSSESAKISIKGKGVALPSMSLPLSAPVTVQLQNIRTGACFVARYGSDQFKINDASAGRFKASRSDNFYSCINCRVFVTSTTHDGNFNGLAGADTFCQSRASFAHLGGNWIAWLSTSLIDAKNRLPNVEYRLVDGSTIVAADKSDLLDGSLQSPIDQTESGGPPGPAFTGTLSIGTRSSNTCQDWRSNSAAVSGATGTTAADSKWTQDTSSACSGFRSLYCFEQ